MKETESNKGSETGTVSSPANKNYLRKSHAERRVNFGDTFIKNLKRKNKLYSVGDSKMVGLRLRIEPTGSKIFYYSYKPANERHTVSYRIGNFNVLNVQEARDKATLYASGIIEGKDPVQIKRELKTELTLKELIEEFYSKRFNRNYGYKPSTIETVKTCFRVWIFQKTTDQEVLKIQEENPYSLQHKKISLITTDHIKKLHNTIRLKAPAVANKVIKFLNVVFNYALEEKIISINPVKMKQKEMAPDREDNRILSDQQRKTILNICWVIDKRTGKLNYNYYKKKRLSVVGCCEIAFWLTTGRRNISEGNSIKWKQISFPTKRILLKDSKVGQKEYNLGPKAMEILKVIYGERLTEGPLQWKPTTQDYVFPSIYFGRKTNRGVVSKTPYLKRNTKTWVSVLKMAKVDYMPPKQSRHTYLTLLLKKTKNIMVVKESAGHKQVKTTNRYVKVLNEDVVSGLEDLDRDDEKEESKVLKFEKK
jgi:integrase